MIDRKLEPLVKRLMVKYLGELEDDDLVMFVLEHLKDHKGPQKLIEGLEPVCISGLGRQDLFDDVRITGSRGRSRRARHRRLETDHLREYGLQRRHSNGENARR